VISTSNAKHYRWGDACDGGHLLAGDDLGVIEERMPPGTFEQRHRHAAARQFFYVLESESQLELEGVPHTLRRGEGLHVPPGAAHQMPNRSGGELRLLVVSAPKSHDDRRVAPPGEPS
jgi:uncharacterized cupin superfamily protein